MSANQEKIASFMLTAASILLSILASAKALSKIWKVDTQINKLRDRPSITLLMGNAIGFVTGLHIVDAMSKKEGDAALDPIAPLKAGSVLIVLPVLGAAASLPVSKAIVHLQEKYRTSNPNLTDVRPMRTTSITAPKGTAGPSPMPQ